MTFLQTFRECFILLPVFDEPVRNFEKIEKRVKSFGDASKMIDFIGRAPNGPIFDEFTILRRNPRPQTRPKITILRRNPEVAGSILQPETKLPARHKWTILEATEVEWVESSTITPP